MYSKLIKIADYRKLMLIPGAIAVFMGIVLLLNGFSMSFEFSGGIQMEINKELSQNQLNSLKNDLSGLDNLKFSSDGKLTVIRTTSDITENEIIGLVEKNTGSLSKFDVVKLYLKDEASNDSVEKLNKRFPGQVSVSGERMLVIKSLNLDKENMKETLKAYFEFNDADFTFEKANLKVGQTSSVLSKTFLENGIAAFIAAYILMSIVVFIAFRTFIPSAAVILSASCDIIFAAGCMSLFGIELQPASLVALIMLIGYSVDTDILLTTRVLKSPKYVDSTIDDSMKTGLTMTFAAMVVAIILFIVSNSTSPPVTALSNIAIVLFFGLIMDILGTWLMNTGILKWYLERPKKPGKKLFKFSLFRE